MKINEMIYIGSINIKRSIKRISLALLSIGFSTLNAQIQITGTVTDDNSQPLIGASVVVKGTQNGTICNVEGVYTIMVEDGEGILVFRYVGYQTKEVNINKQTVIDVQLARELLGLDELVIVGYGSQLNSEITGSIATVDVDELGKSQSLNVTDRLQGKVAGVTVTTNGLPGSIGKIKIRGVSFFGSNDPLFVIDGMVMADSPNLNPNDIESLQVLKDASSLAIYGSRAANGIIIIQTKKGNIGKPIISASASVGIQNLARRIELADNYRWAEISNSAQDNAGRPRDLLADTEFNPDINTDWQDAIYNKNALIQDFNLSVSGASERHSYYFSLNNAYQETVIDGPLFDRVNLRLNSEYKLTEKITIGENITIGKTNTSGLGTFSADFEQTNPLVGAYGMFPVIPVYDSTKSSGYGHGELGEASTYAINPVGQQDMFKNRSQAIQILGNVYLQYNITKDLEYKFTYGVNTTLSNVKEYNPGGQIRASTSHLSRLSQSRGEYIFEYIENRLTYKKEFNKHKLSLMATHAEERLRTSFQATESIAGYETPPYYWQISASTTPTTSTGEKSASALRSYLGRITYNYDGKYLLNIMIRADGSSKFAPENRWGFFPSISGGWNMHKENFFEVPAISKFKIRAGYGRVGSAGIDPYSYQSLLVSRAIGGVNYNLGPSSRSVIGTMRGDVVNRNIRWEALEETNIGIDLELLGGQISILGDYYFGEPSDLLANPPIPGTVGSGGTPTVNAVTLKRTGWESSISYRHFDGEFNYSITGNLFNTNNQVLLLPYGQDEILGNNSITRVGTPVGQLFLLEYEGIYIQEEIDALDPDFKVLGERPQVGDSKYKDTNGRDENNKLTGEADGKINPDDRVAYGIQVPKLNYGLNIEISYKDFDFSIFFQGISRRDVYNSYYDLINTGRGVGGASYTADYDPYIIGDDGNGSGTDPRVFPSDNAANNAPSTRFVENGAYLRLKNIQLGYTIPVKRVQSMRIYISGQNLFTLTKYRGLDPDFEGGLFETGMDPLAFPNIRMLNAGLNITF